MAYRWYNIWKRRRAREDYSEWSALIETPDTNGSFSAGDDDTLTLPGPATLMLRCDGPVDEADFRVESDDGTVAYNKAADTDEAVVLGTFEEGEVITIYHESGSSFSGDMELGIRDPAGRFQPVFTFTCP